MTINILIHEKKKYQILFNKIKILLNYLKQVEEVKEEEEGAEDEEEEEEITKIKQMNRYFYCFISNISKIKI
jgi:hypothetical protein